MDLGALDSLDRSDCRRIPPPVPCASVARIEPVGRDGARSSLGCQPNGPDVMPPICVIMRRCNPRVPGLWLASWDVSALPVMSAAPPSALGRCAAAPRVAHRSRPTHQPRALRGHPASPPNLWPRLKGRRSGAEQRRVRHQRPLRPISLCSRPSSGRFFQVDSFHPRQRVPSTGAVAARSPIISGEMSAWTCFGSWRVPPRSPASS